jgi:hypothetical protein
MKLWVWDLPIVRLTSLGRRDYSQSKMDQIQAHVDGDASTVNASDEEGYQYYRILSYLGPG